MIADNLLFYLYVFNRFLSLNIFLSRDGLLLSRSGNHH